MSGKLNAGPKVVNASSKITPYAGRGNIASFIETPIHEMIPNGINIAAHEPFIKAGSDSNTSNRKTPTKLQLSPGS